MTAQRFVGSRVARVEDARLLTGRGTFVDDVVRPVMTATLSWRIPMQGSVE